MFAITTFLLASLGSAVAQAPPQTPPQAPPAQAAQPLESGVCLDSARAVPQVLKAPVSRSMQIIRIDQVVSTATMTPGEVIGFLYTTQDGMTWLGERTADYASSANATAINQVLEATHVGSAGKHNDFPPESHYGVQTKSRQLFQVRIPPDAFGALRIQLAPCVVWPPSRPLPDPSITY